MSIKIYWGKILRELRTKHNLTQSDIAKLLHISRPAYSNIELGKAKPTAEMIAILTEIYDTELNRYVINSLPREIVAEQHEFKANMGIALTDGNRSRKSGTKASNETYYGKSNEDILDHLD